MSLSLFGIILGLVLLMFLAYKGYSIIWVAPVCAVVVAVLSGYAILDAYIGDYMKGMADYVLQWAWHRSVPLSKCHPRQSDESSSGKRYHQRPSATQGPVSPIPSSSYRNPTRQTPQ